MFGEIVDHWTSTGTAVIFAATMCWGPGYVEKIGVGFELPNHYLKCSALKNLEFFASLYRRRSRDSLTCPEATNGP